jgi:hypothetical protein
MNDESNDGGKYLKVVQTNETGEGTIHRESTCLLLTYILYSRRHLREFSAAQNEVGGKGEVGCKPKLVDFAPK